MYIWRWGKFSLFTRFSQLMILSAVNYSYSLLSQLWLWIVKMFEEVLSIKDKATFRAPGNFHITVFLHRLCYSHIIVECKARYSVILSVMLDTLLLVLSTRLISRLCTLLALSTRLDMYTSAKNRGAFSTFQSKWSFASLACSFLCHVCSNCTFITSVYFSFLFSK